MGRPSKKDIKAAIDKLKGKDSGVTEIPHANVTPPEIKHNSVRIRKQGV